jgi:hypothetical protein
MARIYFIILILSIRHSYSQTSNTQGWIETMATTQCTDRLAIENGITYSTLYAQPKWRAFDYSLSIERNFKDRIDLIGQGILSYTVQNDNYNTLELRPVIGLRWYIIKSNAHRFHLRALIRIENRNIKNLTDKTWENSIRPRLRFEMIVPLNKKRLNEKNVWYGMVDFEILSYSNNITERFANKNRSRFGLGYRFNDCWRIEGIVMFQQSRNNIGESFEQSDVIFRFRIRYNFPSSNKVTNGGIGN